MDPKSYLPNDPCVDISKAITEVEHAAAHAIEFGRLWTREGDKAHGKRWFAKGRELERIAKRLRQIQYDALHPKPVDTPLTKTQIKCPWCQSIQIVSMKSESHQCSQCGCVIDFKRGV